MIMFSLPLAVVGAFGLLAATGNSLNMMSMIGLILLTGLVGKNAILLVDYTNTLRQRGVPRNQALLQAGPTRLRPILMTTSALVLAMSPIALKLGEGSEWRAPMAVTVIGGLLTSHAADAGVDPGRLHHHGRLQRSAVALAAPGAHAGPGPERRPAPTCPTWITARAGARARARRRRRRVRVAPQQLEEIPLVAAHARCECAPARALRSPVRSHVVEDGGRFELVDGHEVGATAVELTEQPRRAASRAPAAACRCAPGDTSDEVFLRASVAAASCTRPADRAHRRSTPARR